MQDIGKRLTASLRMDAINGNAEERMIVARQAKEAITEINRLRAEVDRLTAENERLQAHD